MVATDPALYAYLYDGDVALAEALYAHHWATEDSLQSHIYGYVAELEGTPVGFALGWPMTTYHQRFGPMRRISLDFLPADVAAIMAQRYTDFVTYLLPDAPDDWWCVDYLSVLPACQGKGIGSALLQHQLQQAPKANCPAAFLDVYDGNPAKQLYEKFGFETRVHSRVPHLEKHGIAGSFRMVKVL